MIFFFIFLSNAKEHFRHSVVSPVPQYNGSEQGNKKLAAELFLFLFLCQTIQCRHVGRFLTMQPIGIRRAMHG